MYHKMKTVWQSHCGMVEVWKCSYEFSITGHLSRSKNVSCAVCMYVYDLHGISVLFSNCLFSLDDYSVNTILQ